MIFFSQFQQKKNFYDTMKQHDASEGDVIRSHGPPSASTSTPSATVYKQVPSMMPQIAWYHPLKVTLPPAGFDGVWPDPEQKSEEIATQMARESTILASIGNRVQDNPIEAPEEGRSNNSIFYYFCYNYYDCHHDISIILKLNLLNLRSFVPFIMPYLISLRCTAIVCSLSLLRP